MIASWPKGESGPKSTTNPVFFEELSHVTVVPAFTQKGRFAFAFGILGVAEASDPLRLIFTVQGAELDPQTFSAVQIFSGCGSEQRYWSRPRCGSWAAIATDSPSSGTR